MLHECSDRQAVLQQKFPITRKEEIFIHFRNGTWGGSKMEGWSAALLVPRKIGRGHEVGTLTPLSASNCDSNNVPKRYGFAKP